jgi:hypothetical protein
MVMVVLRRSTINRIDETRSGSSLVARGLRSTSGCGGGGRSGSGDGDGDDDSNDGDAADAAINRSRKGSGRRGSGRKANTGHKQKNDRIAAAGWLLFCAVAVVVCGIKNFFFFFFCCLLCFWFVWNWGRRDESVAAVCGLLRVLLR